jgi:hypothetical protein
MTFRRNRVLAKWIKRLRRVASILMFMIYIAIATAHVSKMDNPRVMSGLYFAAGVAHLAA